MKNPPSPDSQNTMKKIAFVCQRYGTKVNGGAELLCRQVAERLTPYYDVTVYTTCAEDYITWANVYPAGEEELNGVHIRRFSVTRERSRYKFAIVKRIALHNPLHLPVEKAWIEEQGPCCPDLIDALKAEHGQYQAILFMTYLYYTTIRGLGLQLNNALLIPTVHDEPPVYLNCYDRVFRNANGYIWNTPEEKAFALKRFPFIKGKPDVITGAGIEVPEILPQLPPELLHTDNGNTPPEYLVYSGRIDRNKGCDRMFEYFMKYKTKHKNNLRLVLTGKEAFPIPKCPDIIPLGFVEEDVKYAVMANALALVLFSRFESLSLVVLESMAVGRPVIVAEECEVLRGHCERSGAGLSFTDYESFEISVELMRNEKKQYEAMCHAAKKYVNNYYQWSRIIDLYREIIDNCNV